MTQLKSLLLQSIDLIEQIEEYQRQEKENLETARKTDIPEYAEVCNQIADKAGEMVTNLEKQLKLTRQQILLIWPT